MSWETMTNEQRVLSAHTAIMRDYRFAMLGGVVCTGEVKFKPIKTAATNGRDVFYDPDAIRPLTRKMQNYLTLHENSHKAKLHCTTMYEAIRKQYGMRLCNIAMDFNVNLELEECDPKFEFIERPAAPFPALLVDPQFSGMSWIEILRVLLQKKEEQEKDPGKRPNGSKGGSNTEKKPGESVTLDDLDLTDDGGDDPTMDEHIVEIDIDSEEGQALGKEIERALAQGKMLANKLAGKLGKSNPLENKFAKRDTNWREHLRDFVVQIIVGDDNSRLCPPNRIMLASGFLTPSRFSESTGELALLCDTSGSMVPYYPIVFGEIARIAQDVKPDSIRVLWWDNSVCGDQVFLPKDYDNLGTLLVPQGGGGTTPSVVPAYMHAHNIKPKAAIWLTDGYLCGDVAYVDCPVLWGVVANESFVAPQGKKVQISVGHL